MESFEYDRIIWNNDKSLVEGLSSICPDIGTRPAGVNNFAGVGGGGLIMVRERKRRSSLIKCSIWGQQLMITIIYQ